MRSMCFSKLPGKIQLNNKHLHFAPHFSLSLSLSLSLGTKKYSELVQIGKISGRSIKLWSSLDQPYV